MNEYINLHYETKNHIATISVDRPKVLNAHSMSVTEEAYL
jgi:hypothetical protein